MAEWLYEAGIGESRAALVEEGTILEAAIEREDDGALRCGAILPARLIQILVPGRRGLLRTEAGEALIEPLPKGVAEGGMLLAEIVRAPIVEPGRPKRARAKLAPEGAEARPGPDLRSRIGTSGVPVRPLLPHQPDALEAAGWSELLDEAATGEIAFAGGGLRLSLTPAMSLFDVDGYLPPDELALRGAAAAARAIRRHGIGGSIGIDLPTPGTKAARQAAAEAIDAHLPQPFERTAVNGFGFLQIVRRRTGPSLPELLQADPVAAAAHALLRSAERSGGAGRCTLSASSAVITRLEAHPEWIARLERTRGVSVTLRADPMLAISGTHVAFEHPAPRA